MDPFLSVKLFELHFSHSNCYAGGKSPNDAVDGFNDSCLTCHGRCPCVCALLRTFCNGQDTCSRAQFGRTANTNKNCEPLARRCCDAASWNNVQSFFDRTAALRAIFHLIPSVLLLESPETFSFHLSAPRVSSRAFRKSSDASRNGFHHWGCALRSSLKIS